MFIRVENNRGYFDFNLDEDDSTYDETYKKYIQETLTPKMKPIIIYEKNHFVTSILENKYKLFVHKELNIHNENNETNLEYKDILDITKIETRFERH